MWSLDLLHSLYRLLHPTAERQFDCFLDAPFKRSVRAYGLLLYCGSEHAHWPDRHFVTPTVLMHRYDAHKCQCLLNDDIMTVLLYASLYRTANKEGNVAL